MFPITNDEISKKVSEMLADDNFLDDGSFKNELFNDWDVRDAAMKVLRSLIPASRVITHSEAVSEIADFLPDAKKVAERYQHVLPGELAMQIQEFADLATQRLEDVAKRELGFEAMISEDGYCNQCVDSPLDKTGRCHKCGTVWNFEKDAA